MCNIPDEIRKAILDAAQFYGMMQHGKDYVTDADSDKIYDEYMMIKAWLDSQPTMPQEVNNERKHRDALYATKSERPCPENP